jgi:hypothetical protein
LCLYSCSNHHCQKGTLQHCLHHRKIHHQWMSLWDHIWLSRKLNQQSHYTY